MEPQNQKRTDYFFDGIPPVARDYEPRDESNRLMSWWRTNTGGRGVCALVGPMGSGKTVLLTLHFRNQLEESRQSGADPTIPSDLAVFYWNFDRGHSPERFLAELAGWLGWKPNESDLSPKVGIVLALLEAATQPILLIIDGLDPHISLRPDSDFATITDANLRQLTIDLVLNAARWRNISCIVALRTEVIDLRRAGRNYNGYGARYECIPVVGLPPGACMGMFRRRGVRGTSPMLAELAERCGRIALLVDLVGIYIARFCDGDANAPIHLPTADEIRLRLGMRRVDDNASDVLDQMAILDGLVSDFKARLAQANPSALELLERLALCYQPMSEEDCYVALMAPSLSFETFRRDRRILDVVQGRMLGALKPPDIREQFLFLAELGLIEWQSDGYLAHAAIRTVITRAVEPPLARAWHEIMSMTTISRLPDDVALLLAIQLATEVWNTPEELWVSTLPRPGTLNRHLDSLETIIRHLVACEKLDAASFVYFRVLGGSDTLGDAAPDPARGHRICNLLLGQLPPNTNPYVRFRLQYDLSCYAGLRGDLRLAAESLCNILAESGVLLRSHHDLGSVQFMLAQIWSTHGTLSDAIDTVSRALIHEVDPLQRACYASWREYFRFLRGEKYDASVGVLRLFPGYAARLGKRISAIPRSVSQIDKSTGDYDHKCWMAEQLRNAEQFDEAHRLLDEVDSMARERSLLLARCQSCIVRARIVASQITHRIALQLGLPSADTLPDAGNVRAVIQSASEAIIMSAECAAGLAHIDLCSARSRLYSLLGMYDAALADACIALNGVDMHRQPLGMDPSRAVSREAIIGIPESKEDGLPRLPAARSKECSYAWGEIDALIARAIAFMGKAAIELRAFEFNADKLRKLPTCTRAFLDRAKWDFGEAMDILKNVESDANVMPGGSAVPQRAEMRRFLTMLENGELPRPLVPIEFTTGSENKNDGLEPPDDVQSLLNPPLRRLSELYGHDVHPQRLDAEIKVRRYCFSDTSRLNVLRMLLRQVHDNPDEYDVAKAREWFGRNAMAEQLKIAEATLSRTRIWKDLMIRNLRLHKESPRSLSRQTSKASRSVAERPDPHLFLELAFEDNRIDRATKERCEEMLKRGVTFEEVLLSIPSTR